MSHYIGDSRSGTPSASTITYASNTSSGLWVTPIYGQVEAPKPEPKVDPDIAWLRSRVQEMCDASGMAA